MSLPASDASTAARVRGLLADVIHLAHVPLELLPVPPPAEPPPPARLAVHGPPSAGFLRSPLFFPAPLPTLRLFSPLPPLSPP